MTLGGVRATEDDLFVDESDVQSSQFIVDLRLVPEEGDEFDEVSLNRFGDAIQLPSPGRQFVVMRTIGTASADGSGIELERSFFTGWPPDDPASQRIPTRPSFSHLALIPFFLLDARRDLVEDLRSRGSRWGSLMADVGLTPGVWEEIQRQLRDISGRLISNSPTLQAVDRELHSVSEALGSTVGGLSVTPLPLRSSDLSRSMDVAVHADASAELPIRSQGMGPRSLAAIMVFRAFTELRLGRSEAVRPSLIAAVEEPEAHLHPQAQEAMYNLLRGVQGQTIISTHSEYMVRSADVFEIRVLRRRGNQVTVAYVPRLTKGSPTLDAREHANVRRHVLAANAAVLFARLVIMYEGLTEHWTLPVFGRHHWGADPCAHGVSLMSVDGANNFAHVAPVLEALGIPWLIFCDGDAQGEEAVAALGTKLGRPLDRTSPEIVMLPAGLDFEAVLAREPYLDAIEVGIEAWIGGGALANYKRRNHGQRSHGGGVRDYESAGWRERVIIDFLRDHKGYLGQYVATAICERAAQETGYEIPAEIGTLFEVSDRSLGRRG